MPGSRTRPPVTSMLFVSPAWWATTSAARSCALREPPEGTAWTALSVWTRGQSRAQAVRRPRFVETGEVSASTRVREILRLRWGASGQLTNRPSTAAARSASPRDTSRCDQPYDACPDRAGQDALGAQTGQQPPHRR